MMRDRPYGAELLAEAQRTLAELTPENRYQALMIAKAMELAGRELEASSMMEGKLKDELRRITASEGKIPELSDILSTRIREGDFDNSEELHEFLRLVVAFKLRETNPSKSVDQPGNQSK